MKILQIIYALSSGGAERFVVDLSNEMVSLNHNIYLCTILDDDIPSLNFYKSELSEEINYINLKQQKGLQPKRILLFYKLIKSIKPDVVHCHQNLVNYIFPLIVLFPKIKFYHTTHNDAPKEVNSKTEFFVRKFFYSTKMMKAITISAETSNSFYKYYKTKSYTEIYNGRNQPLPSSEFEKVLTFFNELRKTNNEIIFLHIGRCVVQKNQKMLISAFNKLAINHPNIKLLMIGLGYDNEIGNELKSIASDKIIFLGEKKNIADYFLNADAFCLSSIHEGMPITLIEALACGCTPICTPVGGIIDTIKNGETGFISISTSEEDYLLALSDFMKRKIEIDKNILIKNYKENYSIQQCTYNHISLFQK